MDKIPKIIHYCWFGNGEKPKLVKACMDTWEKCEGYKVMEWNSSNCDFESNPYVKSAFEHKRWAFLSDYFRLKALEEYGGVYLDTDVEITKTFDDLLHYDMFCGFIYDSIIGTAIIGTKPHHPFMKYLLEIYNDIEFQEYQNDLFELQLKVPGLGNQTFLNNNGIVTKAFMEFYSDFKVTGKFQEFENICIYPKDEFEIGPIIGKGHTIHHCDGSWKKDASSASKRGKRLIKKAFSYFPVIHMDSLLKHINYAKINKNTFNYQNYLKDSNKL